MAKIERVVDFVYLGPWTENADQDFKVRKANAWRACNIRVFQATVESILLCVLETWTDAETLAKRINGCLFS